MRSIDTIPIDEFRHDGVGLGCFSNKNFKDSDGYLNCLKIGPIFMRMTIKEVENTFRTPVKIIENDGSQTRVYLLPTTDTHLPYFAITFKKNKVSSIQLTGYSTTSNVSFSSIKLGTHYKKVLEILGKPNEISKVPDIEGVIWDYEPFPFSIEFINRKVYSIKLSDKKQ
jgi:hypothetical protein